MSKKHEEALRETIRAMRGYAGWIGRTPCERELINAIRVDVERARRALGVDDEGEPSSTTLVPIERHGKMVVFETRPWPQKGRKRWSVGSTDGLGVLEEFSSRAKAANWARDNVPVRRAASASPPVAGSACCGTCRHLGQPAPDASTRTKPVHCRKRTAPLPGEIACAEYEPNKGG